MKNKPFHNFLVLLLAPLLQIALIALDSQLCMPYDYVVRGLIFMSYLVIFPAAYHLSLHIKGWYDGTFPMFMALLVPYGIIWGGVGLNSLVIVGLGVERSQYIRSITDPKTGIEYQVYHDQFMWSNIKVYEKRGISCHCVGSMESYLEKAEDPRVSIEGRSLNVCSGQGQNEYCEFIALP